MAEGDIRLIEGSTAALTYYLVSDKLDITTTITLSPLTLIKKSFEEPINLALVLQGNPLSKVTDDWRLMTKDEIKAYIQEEREQSRSRTMVPFEDQDDDFDSD